MPKHLLVIAAALMLTACANNAGPKQTVGTVLGAAGGGLAGAQIGSGAGQLVATALGTVLGGVIGSEIGSSLDKADTVHAQRQAAATAAARRQVPVPNYGYSVPRYEARDLSATAVARPVAPASSPFCRRVDEGFNPIFVCNDANGRSFVTQ